MSNLASGFPLQLLGKVRCTLDGGELKAVDAEGETSLRTGAVQCLTCSHRFEVRDGVLDMLGADAPSDEESAFELQTRDSSSPIERGTPGRRATWEDEAEFSATLERLGSLRGANVLELGCGDGFYTRHLESRAAAVLCVDFSQLGLVRNAALANTTSLMGFVRADVSTLKLAQDSFDAALNTLYSNLPTPGLRDQCNSLVLSALKPGGRYVVSAHHYNLRSRRKGWPMSGHYEANGVFFQTFTCKSFGAELHGFVDVDVQPIVAKLPLVPRIPSQRVRYLVSRLADNMPVLKDLGILVIGRAHKPRR